MNEQQEDFQLGQFIPLHYHYVMLKDPQRMESFIAAIEKAVPPGSRVLELGGGTGVLSYFAAQRASEVYCVERNPQMAQAARRFLAKNKNGERVEVILEDAATYVPPNPVDVVICEMLHTGMVREKQLNVIAAFKENYRKRFGPRLPRFVPEAAIQAIQPVEVDFRYYGYYAPGPFFENDFSNPDVKDLGDRVAYQTIDYRAPYDLNISWSGNFPVLRDGKINACRFVLNNLLMILVHENRSIDWLCRYMIVPLEEEIEVRAGQTVSISFAYLAGCSLEELERSLKVSIV